MVDLVAAGRLIPSVSLVIFDRDGTLIDIHRYWTGMLEMRSAGICRRFGLDDKARDGLSEIMGIDVRKNKIKSGGPVGIKKRDVVMQAAIDYLAGRGITNSDDVCADIFRDVDERSESRLLELVVPLPGAKKIVADLRAGGCRCAIATSDMKKRALLTMDVIGMTDAFDMMVGADEVARPKPAPDMIHRIIGRLHADLLETVMVGDASVDIEMGINAGVKASIGVCSGLGSHASLASLTNYVVGGIADIEIKTR